MSARSLDKLPFLASISIFSDYGSAIVEITTLSKESVFELAVVQTTAIAAEDQHVVVVDADVLGVVSDGSSQGNGITVDNDSPLVAGSRLAFKVNDETSSTLVAGPDHRLLSIGERFVVGLVEQRVRAIRCHSPEIVWTRL